MANPVRLVGSPRMARAAEIAGCHCAASTTNLCPSADPGVEISTNQRMDTQLSS